ncbi:MAG: MBL fold metallo-hydrolase [Phycisphaerales bacterium]|nr:MBL fold metallo-hydrolase [Phycisphaerales bacterium]
MHSIWFDEEDVASAALMKLAVVLDACLSCGDDHFMLVVVLVAWGVSAGPNGVVTHCECWRTVLSADHQSHRHAGGADHLHRHGIHLFDAPFQHGREGSGYVLTVAKLRIKGFPLGAWQTNCWLVWIDDVAARPGWIIDTGDHPAPLIAAVRAHGIAVEAILFTHAHLDHIMGLEEVVAALGDIPRHAHPLEHAWFGDPQLNLSAFAGVPPVSVRGPTHSIVDGDTLSLGVVTWRAVHTPGHSPGSVSFVCDAAKVVIAGDTLFAGSIGRSDFPGSDGHILLHSIHSKLMTLPDEFVVHPGHGPSTTIGTERRNNSWLQE